MNHGIFVSLPPGTESLAPLISEQGCIPVIDATGAYLPLVPEGAWVRTRPGRPAPGTGPVILAESRGRRATEADSKHRFPVLESRPTEPVGPGVNRESRAPIPGRPTWLESSASRHTPKGYEGLVLKGRESSGLIGELDGLQALANCPDPSQVILDGGLGPHTSASAAALGAAGVLVVGQHLACPELSIPLSLRWRLRCADDELTCVVQGIRVGNSPTAPVLLRLAMGEDPWTLADGIWEDGDLQNRLWLMGQGAGLAVGLVERHGNLPGLLQAYRHHWLHFRSLAAKSQPSDTKRPVFTSRSLNSGTAAGVNGMVGSGVLWEIASWTTRPIHGEPTIGAIATGNAVVIDKETHRRTQDALVANSTETVLKTIKNTFVTEKTEKARNQSQQTFTAHLAPGPPSEPTGDDDEPPVLESNETDTEYEAAQTESIEVPTEQLATLTQAFDDGHFEKLPTTFRIRRPVLVERALGDLTELAGRKVLVLGQNPPAEAIRAALAERGALSESPYDLVVDVGASVIESFKTAQSLNTARPGGWLTLTRLGGLTHRRPTPYAYLDGARAGFAKALGREWHETHATVLDLPPEMENSFVAAAVCDELAGFRPPMEVFRDHTHRRIVEYSIEEPPPSDSLPANSRLTPGPPGSVDRVSSTGNLCFESASVALRPRSSDPVVLITGGGSGVCARIALHLSHRGYKKMALVGRGPVADDDLDLEADKKRIRNALVAMGARVTDEEVEKRLAPLRKAFEVRQTIKRLEATGATVHYFRFDLANPNDTRQLLKQVKRVFGALNIVVHGVGEDKPQALSDKSEQDFLKVFAGKAHGGRVLLENIGPDAFFVSMGSHAGRLGSTNQTDYAAANEAMARMCLVRPRSLHVDWTVWDEVGKNFRSGLHRVMSQQGLELLPANGGAALLVDMIASEVTGEVLVSGHLGNCHPQPNHPFLDRIEYGEDNIRAYKTLALTTEPWVADHYVERTPALPLAMALELMAATASLLIPDQAVVGADDIRFDTTARVQVDAPTRLVIEASAGEAGQVVTRLWSSQQLKTGQVLKAQHARATILFGFAPDIQSLPSVFLPDEHLNADQIYKRFPHGPLFQIITSTTSISQDFLLATGRIEKPLPGSPHLTAPLALEGAFQAAVLHRMLVNGTSALPFSIEELRFLAPEPQADFSFLTQTKDGTYHLDVDSPTGPLLRIRGCRIIDTGPLKPDVHFPEPQGGRPICFV
ncbi:MAG: SDR family NAD(P)-dependent oxidoreductase [Proteobacteria bacterium]|jgi:NAD(P)-dependent dehydrogenase (short-subunit alcohol dehydrogenase family)|nr:SDR family NAD(P)-dependent oxidoreductase [Pseudomonadota bacterium]